jgi:hypothetical protein
MKSGCGGCLVFFILAGAAVVAGQLIAGSSSWGTSSWVVVGIGVVVALGVAGLFMPSTRCEICSAQLKRKRYVLTTGDGKKRVICPNCNREAERRMSKEAMRRAFGD